LSILLSPTPRKPPSEMLLPIHSTTALMCEVVFAGGETSRAIWYRNGEEVGTVSSDTNAIFEDRNYTAEQPVPEVGFLIMSNITKEDEGLYWCRHAESGVAGEVFSLKVAYVDEIPAEKYIEVTPHQPLFGDQVTLLCPMPRAVPQPTISWLLNGEPVVHTSMDAHSYPNGTLSIRHFSAVHNGVYECVVSNFAARTSSRVVIDTKRATARSGKCSWLHGFESAASMGMHGQVVSAFSANAPPTARCSLLFRSSVLWFLVGCLVTSCSVLIYLLCALVLIRPTPRATMVPSMWARSNPLLGPGFRKVIVPVPDFIHGRLGGDRNDEPTMRSYEQV
uniref:Ig-like domain-containing protein n=1 Tax=Heligmosomoides polygyrus TaxID=6339 RepID=A0A8L8JWM3_HELPZ